MRPGTPVVSVSVKVRHGLAAVRGCGHMRTVRGRRFLGGGDPSDPVDHTDPLNVPLKCSDRMHISVLCEDGDSVDFIRALRRHADGMTEQNALHLLVKKP